MQRYFVQICFKGTNYHGWQIQPNATTVQGVLEKAFSILLCEKISIVGAGRTDTGVHASFFVFHFDYEGKNIDTARLVYRLNSFLPPDIAIRKIWKVPPEAHARFSAVSRTYKYYITDIKDPFKIETVYLFHGKPDIGKMNEAAALLKEYDDFTSFSRLHADVKTNFCKIFFARWEKENHTLVFTVTADRFLRNMVRALVGTLLEVGRGKLSPDEFRNVIEKKDRCAAGPSAPAHGLFLVDISYLPEFGNNMNIMLV